MEELFEWRKWTTQIPKLRFPADWDVQITPPVTGAVVRFRVSKPDCPEEISVYLDCYGVLGACDTPYWEIYPDFEGSNARFDMLDTAGLLDGIAKALAAKSNFERALEE